MIAPRLMPKSFSIRIIAMVFTAGSIPVIIFSVLLNFFSHRLIGDTERAIEHGQNEQWLRSQVILTQMSEDFIRQKAFDIALQLDLYLQGHPGVAVEELRKDRQFREIAVQPVGREGYSAVHDSRTAISVVHPNQQLEGSNLNKLADEFPQFWHIINSSLGGRYAHGDYVWRESDGQTREKFMYIVPLGNLTADGVQLAVGATAYKDDFNRPLKAAREVAEGTSHLLALTIDRSINSLKIDGFMFMTISIVIVLCLACWTGYYFSQAIKLLRMATNEVNRGNFDIRLKQKMPGDVGQLIDEFNRMTDNLAVTTVKKERLEIKEQELKAEIGEREKAEEELRVHQGQLEDLVRDRTSELRETNRFLKQEIEERKQAVRRLEQNEQRLAVILRASPVGIGHVVNRKLDWANEMMYQILGYEQGSLLHQDASILYQNDVEYQRVGKLLEEVIARGETGQVITRWRRKDGTLIDCSLRAHPLKANEPGQGMIVAVSDISEARGLEEKLQRAQKMEVLGTLAGGVAHDLNNILSGLVSYPELILLDLPESSPLRKPLLAIQRSGQEAAAIVQDLLTMARRGVAATEIVNVNTIISNQLATPEFEQMLRYHPNVKLKIDISENVANIKGSGPHLAKTVMNLINNAAEAMPDGGTICISTENVAENQIRSGYEKVAEGEYIAITVVDEGVGISQEEMAHIFEPFYTKKKMGRSGSGLGMAVVWGTVRDHQGYIDIVSEPGRGSSIILYFPVTHDVVSEEIMSSSLAAYMGGGESVLVVDDSAAQREIAQAILARLNYSVDTVSSGEEAVKHVTESPVDLLILDMIMEPGIDGLETFRRISAITPNQKLVIVSGFSETEKVYDLQQMSGGEYLKKPYTIEQIGKAVQKALKK